MYWNLLMESDKIFIVVIHDIISGFHKSRRPKVYPACAEIHVVNIALPSVLFIKSTDDGAIPTTIISDIRGTYVTYEIQR